ncbi:hypothetical protein [Nocardia altamirensis]|uniref:hypothetical protein n=1 Tax=Nocardia altamirensis TaxID=472158 RepID=UPI00083FDB2E|nr:hypothetical protein [Nocardia altamirensis]
MFQALLVLNPAGGTIDRIDLADLSVRTIVDNVRSFPDGIAYDPVAGRIYWTNMGVPDLDPDLPPAENTVDFSPKNGSLESVTIEGTDRRVVLPVGALTTGKQLDADFAAGQLFWSDREGRRVSRVAVDGTGLTDLVVNPVTGDKTDECVGIAVDPAANTLYWTQKGPTKGGRGRIFRANLVVPEGQTAQHRTDIDVLWENLPEPVDLWIDTANHYLYWTDRGAEPAGNTLNRAPIPGRRESGWEPEILARGFGEAVGLAVDPEAGIAYVTGLDGVLRAVALDGSSDSVIAKFEGQSLTGIVGI